MKRVAERRVIQVFIANDWQEYEVIDTGGGEKLERLGEVILRRPDPLAIWPIQDHQGFWKEASARYYRSTTGGGQWEYTRKLPERWAIHYDSLSFHVRPTGFKHTGLFPEQAVNWRWIMDKIRAAGRPVRVLNLFAYTGGATLAAVAGGAVEVVHVDAAKGMVQWAKENLQLSGLGDRTVRFITEDVFKFVQREQRRGRVYDAIIMDPPSYGRGPHGETWKLESNLFSFIEECVKILAPKPLFVLVNSYTTMISPSVLQNVMTLALQKKLGGKITTGEIGLPVTASGIVLPAGILGRWEEEEVDLDLI